jgi:hypothetical protein
VWNNPPGPTGRVRVPTFWYAMMNQFLVVGAAAKLALEPEAGQVLRAAAVSYADASDALQGDWGHTGFDFAQMQAVDNGQWKEGDVAGGVAWLCLAAFTAANGTAHAARPPPRVDRDIVDVVANATRDSSRFLDVARSALGYLASQDASPLYECVLPMGVLAAARLNAEHNDTHNVTQLLEWSLSDGSNQYRSGWGMLGADAIWGGAAQAGPQTGSGQTSHTTPSSSSPSPPAPPQGRSAGGLIGSITDGGGYAFTGNGAWWLAALAPVARYRPAYAHVLGRWALNLVAAMRFSVPSDASVAGRQSNPAPALGDSCNCVPYEGIRRCDFNRTYSDCVHGDNFGPFATGDWCEAANCGNITYDCQPGIPCSQGSDRALYGGAAALGILAAVAGAQTNDSRVLQLNLTATDAYGPTAWDTVLLYNSKTSEQAAARVGGQKGSKVATDRVDVYDAGARSLLVTNVTRDNVTVVLAPDTAAVIVLAPAGAQRRDDGGRLEVGGRVVAWPGWL